VNGMIAEAHREIRWQLQVAERRRNDRARIIGPFAYVDSLIAELEAMHLDGLRVVPASFLPQLLAVNRLLPGGIEPLLGWRRRTRDAIGQCFELQERLLALRDPVYVQRLEADQEADSDLREELEA
jgi:hypothetical protein